MILTSHRSPRARTRGPTEGCWSATQRLTPSRSTARSPRQVTRSRTFVCRILSPGATAQRPCVLLIDADAAGALDAVAEMRDALPGADDVHVLFLCASDPGPTVSSAHDTGHRQRSGVFVRPIQMGALLSHVATLWDRLPNVAGDGEPTTPPSGAPTTPQLARMAGTPPSLPPPSMRSASGFGTTPDAALPSRMPNAREASAAPSLGPTRRFSPVEVSPELRALLADAEEGIKDPGEYVPSVPSPEEEIESVLPAELLAALDEPIEGEDAEEDGASGFRAEASSQAPERTSTGERDASAPSMKPSETDGQGDGRTSSFASRRRLSHPSIDEGSASRPPPISPRQISKGLPAR